MANPINASSANVGSDNNFLSNSAMGKAFSYALTGFQASPSNLNYQDAYAQSISYVLSKFNVGIELSTMGSDNQFHKVYDNAVVTNGTTTYDGSICP